MAMPDFNQSVYEILLNEWYAQQEQQELVPQRQDTRDKLAAVQGQS